MLSIPALLMVGITLIAPLLISLMKGQVDTPARSGVAVASINSSLSGQQIALVLHKHYLASIGKKVFMRRNMVRCLMY